MKKLLLLLISVTLFITLTACAQNHRLYSNLSELRDNIYTGEDENYKVDCYTGFREKNYQRDGVVTTAEKIFNLKVRPSFEYSGAQEFSATVTVNGTNYNGTLTRHFEKDYLICSLPIEKISAKSFDVSIFCEGESSTVRVASVKEDNEIIDINTALGIMENELADTIAANTRDGIFMGEIHARLIDIDDEYFWYIGIITDTVKNQAVLLRAGDGSVVAKKAID